MAMQTHRSVISWLPILSAAALTLLLLLITAEQYGYHRDELYFLAAAEHLEWGFVDQPPLTPAVAGAATALFGDSLLVLRLAPALAAVAIVILTGLITREMGGGRFAQGFAALCAAVSTMVLAIGHLLATSTFDLLAWVLIAWLVARILRGGDPRQWMLVGVVVGIGLLNKHLVAFLVVGVLIALATVGPRHHLRSRWLWAGAAIGLVVFSPNLIWQATNGWSQLDMAGAIVERSGGIGGRIEFFALQLIAVNPLLVPIWVWGLVKLLTDATLRPFRSFAVGYLVLLGVFAVIGGKFYYLGGLYMPLVAAGAIALERRVTGAVHQRLLTAGVLVAGVIGLPFSLPVLPAEVTGTGINGVANKELRETIGWPELVATVGSVYEELEVDEQATTTIITRNYGQAGAIERWMDEAGLPQPHSGQNSYWEWGPPPDSATTAILVGFEDESLLSARFTSCDLVATISNDAGAENDELDAPVHVCRDPIAPWSEQWSEFRVRS